MYTIVYMEHVMHINRLLAFLISFYSCYEGVISVHNQILAI